MIRLVHRDLAAWVVLVVTAVLVAGCGSSTHASSISAPVGADKPIADAQTVAYAHAVNLRASDVPELVPAARQKEGTGIFLGRCEMPAGSREVLGIPSQGFRFEAGLPTTARSSYHKESVRSVVYVMKSPTLAAHALAMALGSVGQACFRRAFFGAGIDRSKSGRAEPLFSHVKILTWRTQVPGVQIQGIRMTASLGAVFAGTRNRQPYYEDILGFVSGPSEIFLKVTSSPSDPAATERRLLALLHTRAEAHKL